MNQTSAMVSRTMDEFAFAALEAAPSRRVKAPRVAAAPANLECTLLQIVSLPSRVPSEPNTMVIGSVVAVHIDDAILTDGIVDVTKMRPIARLGGSDYAVVDSVFKMGRP